MKPFDFSRLEKGRENKVRHFGGGDSVFTPSHGKSKNELNLLKKSKVAGKMQSKEYKTTRCGHCGKFGHHHDDHKPGYTGHYQEDAAGRIRHQSPLQVKKKNLGQY